MSETQVLYEAYGLKAEITYPWIRNEAWVGVCGGNGPAPFSKSKSNPSQQWLIQSGQEAVEWLKNYEYEQNQHAIEGRAAAEAIREMEELTED